ncbi:hypothetical protein [Bradyrhizobium sp. 613_E4_N2_2]|uniref:hypothetical protein n=1 Tax=Bradyrhizobium sp. 613_E4_N2_2 TaxID=3240371 RepID=UPI003F8A6702
MKIKAALVDTALARPADVQVVADERGMAFVDGLGWVVQCSRAVEYVQAVATAGDGVTPRFKAIGHAASDEVHRAANLLEKLPGRYANEAATIRTAVAYLREYGNVLVPPSAPRVGVLEGWKVVPIQSTLEMDRAGGDALVEGNSVNWQAEQVWKAMLTAAPESSS